MPPVWVLLGVIALAGGAGLLLFPRIRHMDEPAHSPADFLKRGREAGTSRVVLCAGDSITHGALSSHYVKRLEAEWAAEGYQFINAGINGDLAYNVLQRLDVIIACQPDVVTLLVGTNDVKATYDDQTEQFYMKNNNLVEKPTLESYHKNVEAIITRLQVETNAHIALLTIPMLGEDLGSDINQWIITYNHTLQGIAAEKGIDCLPLYDGLLTLIPPDHAPPPYDSGLNIILKAGLKHYVLRKSWDDIAAENGLAVLTDHTHLNDKAAAILASLISNYLKAQHANKT